MNLSEAWEEYRIDKEFMGYSPNTLKQYAIQVRLMIRYFGDVEFKSLTYEMIKKYLSDTTGHLKPSSIGHRMRFLKSLFRWAIDEGYIDHNPTRKLKEPREGQRIPKFLTIEQIETIKSGCKTKGERALIEILFSTGMRIGEVHSLNKNDVNIEERTIKVIGKGDKERVVFFNPTCKVWLNKYMQSRNDDEEALFVTERKPYRRTSIAQLRYIVKRIADRSGVGVNVYPHKFRHSVGQAMLERNAPISFISNFLGHARPDITERFYLHINNNKSKELYDLYF